MSNTLINTNEQPSRAERNSKAKAELEKYFSIFSIRDMEKEAAETMPEQRWEAAEKICGAFAQQHIPLVTTYMNTL